MKFLRLITDKILLTICAFFIFFLFLYFIFFFFLSDNYLIARIRYELTKDIPSSYIQPSQNWKNYSLSNVVFQAPENYRVSIYEGDKYEGGSFRTIIYTSSRSDIGTMGIDSKPLDYRSYDEAKQYFKESDKIKIYKFEESNNKFRAVGQRYEFLGLGSNWVNFDHTVINIDNKPVLVWLTRHEKDLISPQTFEKIVTSIKPLK